MSALEDLHAAIARAEAMVDDSVQTVELALTCQHLMHPGHRLRLLRWDEIDQAEDWVQCAALCGTFLPLGPRPWDLPDD